jgi:hypothetical protein
VDSKHAERSGWGIDMNRGEAAISSDECTLNKTMACMKKLAVSIANWFRHY